MEFREKEFVRLPNPKGYALFLLRAHREKKSKWQTFVHRHRYHRSYAEYDKDVRAKMIYKLCELGLLESKNVDAGVIPVPTKKGLCAIRNRRIDYNVGWWTVERDRWVTRIMALIATIISIVSLFV